MIGTLSSLAQVLPDWTYQSVVISGSMVVAYLSAQDLDFMFASGGNGFNQSATKATGSACDSNDTHCEVVRTG